MGHIHSPTRDFLLYVFMSVETKRSGDNDLSKLTSRRTGVGRKQLNGEINHNPNSIKLTHHYMYRFDLFPLRCKDFLCCLAGK